MSNYDLSSYETAVSGPVSGSERLAAAACHGAMFLALPFVLPAAIWLLFPLVKTSPYVRTQAVQAMLFHLLVTIVGAVLGGSAAALWYIILIGWPFAIVASLLAGVFGLWSLIIMVIATYKAFMGEPYRYPLVGG